ncbi:MAG: phosphotransferase [Pseudomonadota bacterium]
MASTDWRDATLLPLAGDASNRRYIRLRGAAGRAVLMDAPPSKGEDVGPFIAMTKWLQQHGFSAPRILAQDAPNGFLILEDLGDALYATHLATAPQQETALYSRAVDVLTELLEIGAPPDLHVSRHKLPPYDAATLRKEAALFVEWWLPAATGQSISQSQSDEFLGLVDMALAPFSENRDVVVVRDYHAENLLWLPDRAGTKAVGLLDYQDACAGHPAYDLMSLLEDARRPTAETLQHAMIERYLENSPSLDKGEFRHAYAALGAGRNLKIVGIFARLALRDGKARYLDLIPQVWSHVRRDLGHPELSDLAAWIDKCAAEPDGATLDRVRAAADTE